MMFIPLERDKSVINTNSSIGHDCNFSNFSSCGPKVAVGGNVFVGNSAFLGIHSTINHNIKIGENTVIGGHSFVNKDCKKNSIYFGVPAKKIRKRKEDDTYL